MHKFICWLNSLLTKEKKDDLLTEKQRLKIASDFMTGKKSILHGDSIPKNYVKPVKEKQ